VFLYFENSEINEMRSYKEGLKHGLWETWNENKIKIAEANFNNNLKHGKWIIWDNNGVKRCEMYYVEGKKSGTWYMWDENDKLINKKEY
ncbi:MAG: toxin-antitoxin system YwqK family antitoxin, partial [Bacteroidetes bacterium]|nr:toxin-antitoxin system YwqK family antitoxin [Bacteroidota bacterium]